MQQGTMSGAVVMDASDTSGRKIALWVARIAGAGVMLAGALPKFFNYTDEGAKQLADALGIGRLEVTALGGVELLAAVLILVPATRAIGARLVGGLMSGAMFSHFTTLGFSGSAPAEMWPLAVLGLAAAAVALAMTHRELPLLGKR